MQPKWIAFSREYRNMIVLLFFCLLLTFKGVAMIKSLFKKKSSPDIMPSKKFLNVLFFGEEYRGRMWFMFFFSLYLLYSDISDRGKVNIIIVVWLVTTSLFVFYALRDVSTLFLRKEGVSDVCL